MLLCYLLGKWAVRAGMQMGIMLARRFKLSTLHFIEARMTWFEQNGLVWTEWKIFENHWEPPWLARTEFEGISKPRCVVWRQLGNLWNLLEPPWLEQNSERSENRGVWFAQNWNILENLRKPPGLVWTEFRHLKIGELGLNIIGNKKNLVKPPGLACTKFEHIWKPRGLVWTRSENTWAFCKTPRIGLEGIWKYFKTEGIGLRGMGQSWQILWNRQDWLGRNLKIGENRKVWFENTFIKYLIIFENHQAWLGQNLKYLKTEGCGVNTNWKYLKFL